MILQQQPSNSVRTSQGPVRTMSMAKEGTAADWVCQVSNTFHQVESPGRVGIGALLKFNFGRVEHSVVAGGGRASAAHHLLANCHSGRAATVWPHGGSKY